MDDQAIEMMKPTDVESHYLMYYFGLCGVGCWGVGGIFFIYSFFFFSLFYLFFIYSLFIPSYYIPVGLA
jgi:hypothetical protein